MLALSVMVVEDDFRVAEINRRVTEQVGGFTVVHLAKTGAEALAFLERGSRVDLVLLDIYLPDIHGIELLKKIRRQDYPCDFILITAAHDAKTVEDSMRHGIFDYLIKPYDFGRYQDTLREYHRRKAALDRTSGFDQGQLDRILEKKTPGPVAPQLPKGVSYQTLARVKAVVDAGKPVVVAADLVEALQLSRITAHRYLDHLVDTGRLQKELRYHKVGRPSIVYLKVE